MKKLTSTLKTIGLLCLGALIMYAGGLTALVINNGWDLKPENTSYKGTIDKAVLDSGGAMSDAQFEAVVIQDLPGPLDDNDGRKK